MFPFFIARVSAPLFTGIQRMLSRFMDPKTVCKLEKALEKPILDVICRLGLGKLPILPSHSTVQMMAKAAVAVYEVAVEEHERRKDGG